MSWFAGLGLIAAGTLLGRSNYRNRARRDQRKFGTKFKNAYSPINDYGTCFTCDGSGLVKLNCWRCNGTGTYEGRCSPCDGSGNFELQREGPCYQCNQTGKFRGNQCQKCTGTGVYRWSKTVVCNKCEGTGDFSASCKRCSCGTIERSCNKCGGTGWHRFR